MKKTFSLSAIVIISFFIFIKPDIYPQVVTGKLVDENANGLPEIFLQLFISPDVYSTNSLSDGSFYFTGVTGITDDGELPSGYSITNNFPNPFNPTTRLGVTLPVDGNVMVNIYNILGQKVSEGIQEYFSAGTHYLDIELYGLSSGLYIAQISIDEKYTVIKKMMLVYGSQHLSSTGSTFNLPLNKPNLDKSNISQNIDSLVATSLIIGRKTFTDLPSLLSDTTNLGNLTIERFCPGIPTVTYEGKIYNTVKIVEQCWLKENLDVGNMIIGSLNQFDNGIIEKYCYNNDSNNCNTYGGLYQWDEAMHYSRIAGAKGICPLGWHIPTYAEFQTLRSTVNFDGNKLKAVGQGAGGGAGTNTSGFSALFAGVKILGFSYLGESTYYWSSSELSNSLYYAYSINLYANNSYVSSNINYKWGGFSVRCLKN